MHSYFPAECTKDMLEEWLPLLCPFDLSSVEGAGYLSEFLPTRLPSHFHQCSFKYVTNWLPWRVSELLHNYVDCGLRNWWLFGWTFHSLHRQKRWEWLPLFLLLVLVRYMPLLLSQPFIKLFVRLARHCMGYVDWSPYLSRVSSLSGVHLVIIIAEIDFFKGVAEL